MRVGGVAPAGSSRCARLDPFALPVRFSANDAGADGQVRVVDLSRERVVMRRAVRGVRMALSLPLALYRGVSKYVGGLSGLKVAAKTNTDVASEPSR